MKPYIDTTELRAGDILLMRGRSSLSDLIAWFGDSVYSHAAVMCSDTHFVEAAMPRSRMVALDERLRQTDAYHFIEVFRPTADDGNPLDEVQRERLARAASQQVGVDYPVDMLVQLAAVAVVRDRIPEDGCLRWLLRELVDHLICFDPEHMVCSELVYQAMRQAELAPTIVVAARLDQPFPDVDVRELVREWLEARGAGSMGQGQALMPEPVNEEELVGAYHRLRQERRFVAGGFSPHPVPDPNPATILPVDLSTSPQVRRLGRLRLLAEGMNG